MVSLTFSVSAQSLQSVQENNSKIDALTKAISALDDDHCEVPCGIYGDSLRVALLKEHSETIAKGIDQVNKLSKDSSPNYNQIVRWVMNKEHHAEAIQEIVSQYFTHQRVKLLPTDSKRKMETNYYAQLESLHKISVYAMKTKQSTDAKNVDLLNKAIHDFEHAYFGDHKH
jgi:nickel superoxide dismutase